MFNFLKTEKVNEQSKEKSFQDYLNKDLASQFLSNIEIDEFDNVGTEVWKSQILLENDRVKHSIAINKQIKNWINLISKLVENEKFKNSLIARIIFMANVSGKINITDNVFEGVYTSKDINYDLKIDIQGNCITFTSTCNDIVRSGKYRKSKDNILVEYDSNEKVIYDLEDDLSVNVDLLKVTRLYNSNNYETFNRTIKIKDNYKRIKKTGHIVMNPPDIMENYTETEYQWRAENNCVLKRTIKKYTYPDGTKAFIDIKNEDNCFLRYEKLKEKEKELPTYGHYYGFDKELFNAYNARQATMDDIVENVHSKKYHMPHYEY